MTFRSHNPATGELIGTYPGHDEAGTNVRLQRAWEGWLRWSRTRLHERRAFLIRLADLLDGRAETYGRLITAEMGTPLHDTIAEIKNPALDARRKAGAGEAYLKPQPIPGLSAQITYESIGPIFSAQPWNLPTYA
jgi:acyl-CoA reductase-like NAD-dependent aldehyde dehydrogenase